KEAKKKSMNEGCDFSWQVSSSTLGVDAQRHWQSVFRVCILKKLLDINQSKRIAGSGQRTCGQMKPPNLPIFLNYSEALKSANFANFSAYRVRRREEGARRRKKSLSRRSPPSHQCSALHIDILMF